jgi:hypothetical protein
MYFATLRHLMVLVLAIALSGVQPGFAAAAPHAEVLVQRIAPAQLDCWRQVEAVWAAFNAGQAGFAGQELYYDRSAAEAVSVVRWRTDAARHQVPQAAIDATVARAEALGNACGLSPAVLNGAIARRDYEQLPLP